MEQCKQLKKDSLGLWSIVFFVVAAASPLTGVVGAMPVAFMAGNGPGVPGIYVLAGLILLLFSFGFVAMSRHVVNAGAFYSYISVGLGRKFGVAGLKVALLAYTAIQISVVAMFGFFSQIFVVDHLGIDIPWWAFSCVMLVIVLLLGIAKVELGGKVLGLLMLMEVGIVLLTDAGILSSHTVSHFEFSSFAPSTMFSGSFGIAMIFAISSFIGFEATAIYSEECKEPAKVIPRATIIAVVLISAFFALTSWSFVQLLGGEGVSTAAAKDPGRFVFAVTTQVVGPWAVELMSVLLITSLFAATQAFHNTMSRYIFSISRDGLLWKPLSAVHTKHGTPYAASIAQTIGMLGITIMVALAGQDPMQVVFSWGSAVGTMSILLLQGAVSLAVIFYFFRNRQYNVSLWSRMIAPAISALAMFGALWKVIENLDILSGSSSKAIFILPYFVFGAAVIGYAIAWALSRFYADRYAQLGKVVEELG